MISSYYIIIYTIIYFFHSTLLVKYWCHEINIRCNLLFNSPACFRSHWVRVHFPLSFSNYSPVVLKIFCFPFVPCSRIFCEASAPGTKNAFPKKPFHRYQFTFSTRHSLIILNFWNQILWPYRRFLFHGCWIRVLRTF